MMDSGNLGNILYKKLLFIKHENVADVLYKKYPGK